VTELESLGRTYRGVTIMARLSPEQRKTVEDSVAWWKAQPEYDRPTRTDVIRLWAKHGIVISEATARRLFD
jgi:hypothetical protein